MSPANETGIWYIVNIDAAILGPDGRYLMIVRGAGESHAPGALALPGGKVERAGVVRDIFEDTLRREIQEEVGVEVRPPFVYVESGAFIADDGDPVVDVLFLCRYASGEPVVTDEAEIAAVRWMAPEDILRHPQAPDWTQHSIELVEKKRQDLGW
jgi:8-oxo-dGTP pyrophosphatase MutT (NUDIX family)